MIDIHFLASVLNSSNMILDFVVAQGTFFPGKNFKTNQIPGAQSFAENCEISWYGNPYNSFIASSPKLTTFPRMVIAGVVRFVTMRFA